ncbi:hypothetical protein K7432_008768 [Basidiobolus ranarum]|uniref:Large ribosomal subunit protein bL28c n=1 Tax=Basidiobolus ranarum TaxID=34480 RepID=A0ABR2VYJ9_9FUNG
MFVTEPLLNAFKDTFKRAQRGLFNGKKVQFGNNKPESNHKTRRRWLPNIQEKQLYSQLHNKMLKIKVTASALRTIDKKGGLDQYLLSTRDTKLFSEFGIAMKRDLEVILQRKGWTKNPNTWKVAPPADGKIRKPKSKTTLAKVTHL